MSLIEKASQPPVPRERRSLLERVEAKGWFDARTDAAQPEPAPQVESAPYAMPSPDGPEAFGARFGAGEPIRSGGRSEPFEINFTSLERRGLITPSTRRSRLSEEIRLIKRRLWERMRLPDGGVAAEAGADQTAEAPARQQNVLMVTSTRPGEGKTFIALNLALSFAIDEGLNVLLIDSDVARPGIASLLGIKASPGLTDVLRDQRMDMADVLHRSTELPLSVMTQGSRVSSATELLGGATMSALIDEMSRRYADRIIIFDSAPLLAATEPVVLARQVDQILFIVESGRTTPDSVTAALDLLEKHDNVNFVLNRGVVMNQSDQFGAYFSDYETEQAGSH